MNDKKKKTGKIILKIIRYAILFTMILVTYSMVWDNIKKTKTDDIIRDIADNSEEEKYEDKEIDFKALWEINQDVVAWIIVPDTEINYPILQSEKEEDYYLRRNIYKEKSRHGCIYIRTGSSKEFSDKLTVVFGHNMRDGTMFRDVEKFLNVDYLDKRRKAYIYTPQSTFAVDLLYAETIGREYPQVNYESYGVDKNYVSLFTCEKKNKRVVLIGKLNTI